MGGFRLSNFKIYYYKATVIMSMRNWRDTDQCNRIEGPYIMVK